MGQPAARLGDQTGHGTPLSPGPGSFNVLIGGKPAWRATSDFHACPLFDGPKPHVGGVVAIGSMTVLINGLPAARVSGQLVYGLCVTVVAIMAAARLGFDTSFLASFLLILAAGCVAMLALSVGLGAGPAIRNLIGTYSVRHFVHVGQQIQVGDMSGKVVDLTSMVLVLDVEGKQVVIPASRLNDSHTTINPQTGT